MIPATDLTFAKYFTRIDELEQDTGDFVPLPVAETAALLMASINGIIRYQVLIPGPTETLPRPRRNSAAAA